MKTDWNSTTKIIVSIGLFLFGVFLLYLSLSVLPLIIVAALIAFLLMPLVNFFHQRLKLPKGIAVLVTYLLATIVLLLSPLIFIPPIVDGFQYLAGIDYQLLIDSAMLRVENLLLALKEMNPYVAGFNVNLDSIIDPALALLQQADTNITPTMPSIETIFRSLRSALTTTFGLATNIAGTLFSGALTFIVTLLSAIYLSLDAPRFKAQFLEIVPEAYRPEMATLIRRLGAMWRAYFRGQLILMLVIGLITWLGNMILGLPGAFALGVIAGVLELIPNLGPFLAAIPAVIVALLQGSTYMAVNNLIFALIVIGFYILVQQLENTLIVPRILGDAVNLHPLVVMIGVLVGANVAGILGALLAAPVIASGREIIRYLYLKVLGQEPFPPEAEDSEADQLSTLTQLRGLILGLLAMLARWQQSRARAARTGSSQTGQQETADEAAPES
jgi:predicted PurR-regulated permease PerM